MKPYLVEDFITQPVAPRSSIHAGPDSVQYQQSLCRPSVVITSPTQLALPGVVRTDRPQLTRNQIADRYLKSVAGNPDIDINKARTGEQAGMPKMVQQQEPRISRSLLARNMACEKNLTVSDYLLARSNEVNYKFIGGTANEICLFTVPEFVTSKNFVLSSSERSPI